MGVFLYLDIVPDRISEKEWASVYQETLTLLDNYEFLGIVKDDKYYYAARSAHQENVERGYAGWWVSGDMFGGRNMEDFLLYSDVAIYWERAGERQSNSSDILLSYLDTHEGPPACCIWGAKTQGCPAHKYLLAIACLICHRLPNAAHVYGDITAGQCHQAVDWANQFLTDPIDVPVTVDMKRLLPRLKAVGLTGHELLHSFYELTLEATDRNMGSYLSEQPKFAVPRHHG